MVVSDDQKIREKGLPFLFLSSRTKFLMAVKNWKFLRFLKRKSRWGL